MTETIGLIAGNGRLPILVAEEATKLGCEVVVCAIQDEADRGIEMISSATEWIRVGQLGKVIKHFKNHNVQKAIMAGKITKTNLFKGEVRPDLEMIQAIAKLANHNDDSLLGAIADHMQSKGIEIIDSTTFLSEDALPKAGVLTKRKPSKQELKDIEFGWKLAKEMGGLDIGQTVVVKKQAVLAVEAIEGTDEAIIRGGILGNGDVTVVKVAKPNQDMRFDVPGIGLKTIDSLIEARAVALAIEAGKTIFIDRKQAIEKANEYEITVVCRSS